MVRTDDIEGNGAREAEDRSSSGGGATAMRVCGGAYLGPPELDKSRRYSIQRGGGTGRDASRDE